MKRKPTDSRREPRRAVRRSGLVLVCVLVCLSIASTLVLTAAAAALKQRQRVRSERQLRQVELLVNAGASRALSRLDRDDSYEGETWRLDAGSLPGFGAASIEIEVARGDEGPPIVTVQANLPADSETPVTRTTQFRINPARR